jgi:hypothetical protein
MGSRFAAAFDPQLSTAIAQGTAYIYQGQLNHGGSPANGLYDLQFSLFDAATGGNQVGGTVTNLAVGVTNGLFTTTLDFGAVFTGNPVWLAISVRTNGAGSYVGLNPLQPVTPVPYAITAGSANKLAGLAVQQNAAGAPNLIGGAPNNFVAGGVVGATIGGGGPTNLSESVYSNTVTANFGTVGGGEGNTASVLFARVGGGYQDIASGQYATVGGGTDNHATGAGSFVRGGGIGGTNDSLLGGNTASGPASTVGGGIGNTASYEYATVGGGAGNTSINFGATVAGGQNNTSSGVYSTVSGGYNNTAAGYISFTAGLQAKALHPGTFVWADSQGINYASTANDQFCIRAQGGVQLDPGTSLYCGSNSRQMLNLYGTAYGIGVQTGTLFFRVENTGGYGDFSWFRGGAFNNGQNNPGGGVEMMRLDHNNNLNVRGTVTANSFILSSDRNLKSNFTPMDARTMLAKVSALPITAWNYQIESGVKHLGPMAQDFYAAFGTGADDKHIAVVDEGGVALAAIQGLNEKLEQQARERDAEIQQLQQSVAQLKELVSKLAQTKSQLTSTK